jgi:hypothetical protein
MISVDRGLHRGASRTAEFPGSLQCRLIPMSRDSLHVSSASRQSLTEQDSSARLLAARSVTVDRASNEQAIVSANARKTPGQACMVKLDRGEDP